MYITSSDNTVGIFVVPFWALKQRFSFRIVDVSVKFCTNYWPRPPPPHTHTHNALEWGSGETISFRPYFSFGRKVFLTLPFQGQDCAFNDIERAPDAKFVTDHCNVSSGVWAIFIFCEHGHNVCNHISPWSTLIDQVDHSFYLDP